MHRTKIKVVEGVLDANDTIAAVNRADLDRAGVMAVNLMSAPGAGKTALLERTVGALPGVRVGVLEGDVQGSLDADRLAALHVPVAQLNTDPGFGGECHLDANMVRSALPELPLGEIDLLVVENVGNLVCPAEFKVGENVRVMVSAITEGEEKPLKYPLMFRACELVLINKMDLLQHLDFDLERFLYNLDAVHPGVDRMVVSAKTGEGIERWREWLARVGRASEPLEGSRDARGRERPACRGPRRAHPGERRVLRGRGRAAGPGVPPHGRALRARGKADRLRPPARRPLRCPPRGGRVRPSRDRRQ